MLRKIIQGNSEVFHLSSMYFRKKQPFSKGAESSHPDFLPFSLRCVNPLLCTVQQDFLFLQSFYASTANTAQSPKVKARSTACITADSLISILLKRPMRRGWGSDWLPKMGDRFAILVDKQKSDKMSPRRREMNPRSSTLNSKASQNRFPDRQGFPYENRFQSPRVLPRKKQHSE